MRAGKVRQPHASLEHGAVDDQVHRGGNVLEIDRAVEVGAVDAYPRGRNPLGVLLLPPQNGAQKTVAQQIGGSMFVGIDERLVLPSRARLPVLCRTRIDALLLVEIGLKASHDAGHTHFSQGVQAFSPVSSSGRSSSLPSGAGQANLLGSSAAWARSTRPIATIASKPSTKRRMASPNARLPRGP